MKIKILQPAELLQMDREMDAAAAAIHGAAPPQHIGHQVGLAVGLLIGTGWTPAEVSKWTRVIAERLEALKIPENVH